MKSRISRCKLAIYSTGSSICNEDVTKRQDDDLRPSHVILIFLNLEAKWAGVMGFRGYGQIERHFDDEKFAFFPTF